MSRMRAVDAIVRILEKEGATQAFGVPGAAINPALPTWQRALRVQSLEILVFALEHRVPVAPI